MLKLNQDESGEDYEHLIESHQGILYRYIVSLTGHVRQADDILQETNLVLWRKKSDFEMGTNFSAWACRIALFQVMAQRQKMSRERLVFTDQLFEMVGEGDGLDEGYETRRTLLASCIAKLPANMREMIKRRYVAGESVEVMAASLGVKPNAMAQTLYRARGLLVKCVRNLDVNEK